MQEVKWQTAVFTKTRIQLPNQTVRSNDKSIPHRGEEGTLSRGVPWTIDIYKKSSVDKQAKWRYMSPASISVRAMQFLAILFTLTGSVW